MNKKRINHTNGYLVYPTDNITVLLSYEIQVAAMIDGTYIVSNAYYSKTTNRHIKQFVGDNSYTVVDQMILDSLVK